MRFFVCIISLLLTMMIQQEGYGQSSGNTTFTLSAGSQHIHLRFQSSLPRPIRLLELAPQETYTPGGNDPVLWEGTPGKDEIVIGRFDGPRDRLYRKFQIVDAANGEAVGPPQWVTDLSGIGARDFEIPWPESKKGVTCIVDVSDAIELGTKYLSEGVVISQIIDWRNPNPEAVWEVDGEKIPINMAHVRNMDRKYKELTDAGVNITLIPVNHVPTQSDPGNPLIHPKTDLAKTPFHHGAFNLTDEKGIRCYRAFIEFLADRYTRPDCRYGLISGLVIGNELQAHWTWHNIGEAPAEEVIPEYVLELRLADLAVRKIHKNLRVYVSLEHHWALCGHLNDPLKEIAGRDFLEGVNRLAKAEGDFPWDLAFHPYPEDLFQPCFWKDRSAILHFETPRITFKNLEVLPAYLRQEHLLFQGKPRRIILSEQGFHTPKEPDGEKIQAACYAYAYYKISHLDGIDAFMLHRHVSARDEGGLDLGLWTFDPNDPSGFAPGRKKFIWDVYRLADTPQWEQAFEFAKPVIGIKDWIEALPTDQIDTSPHTAVSTENVVFDFYSRMNEAELIGKVEGGWRPDVMIVAGGWPSPSIFHHPPEVGVGKATFKVPLPPLEKGKRLMLRFHTGFAAETENGVEFAVLVDGQEVWKGVQKEVHPEVREIDLSQWAGRVVPITLRVDALVNTSYDWAQWVQPRIFLEDVE